MGLLLLFIAKILQWLLTPVFSVYSLIRLIRIKKYRWIYILDFKLISKHFGLVAFGIDQLGNITGSVMMNDILLKKESKYPYGDPDMTISHVTGVNYMNNHLTLCGLLVAKTLNKVDKDHVQNAAVNEQ